MELSHDQQPNGEDMPVLPLVVGCGCQAGRALLDAGASFAIVVTGQLREKLRVWGAFIPNGIGANHKQKQQISLKSKIAAKSRKWVPWKSAKC